MKPVAAIVAGTLLLALLGFGVGRVTASSGDEAREARESAKAEAYSEAKRAAYDKGRKTGLTEGRKKGREDGDAAGERKGLEAGQEAAGTTTTGGTTTGGTTGSGGSTGSTGSSGGSGTGTGTPDADTPEGKEVIENSPDCQDNPPPPGYDGPVQC